jgi:hypothetical protein
MEAMLKVPYSKYRIEVLKKFLDERNPSIDLGSGGFMPNILGVTHACDDSMLAGRYLKTLGWNGKFKVVDITKPLPYKDKQFKVALCSEVIEHFRTKKLVSDFFKEINRISEFWIVTTPSVFFQDRDHNFVFTPTDLFEMLPWGQAGHLKDYIIFNKMNYYYITNDIERLSKIMEIPI